MNHQINRRGFLKAATFGTTGWWILKNSRSVWSAEANEKLNIALVGVGNQGRGYIGRTARINPDAIPDRNHR